MQPSFITFHHTTPRILPRLQRVCTRPHILLQTQKRLRLRPHDSQPSMALQVLWQTALSTAVYQATFFTITYIKRSEIVTDLAGTSNFILVALQSFIASPGNIRSKIVTSFVVTWATRLGGFLFNRILRWGHDKRFDKTRDSLSKLGVFWTAQAVWVWVVSLPVTLLNGSAHANALGTTDYVGWALFLCGFVTEAVADMQKLRHKMKSDKWIDTGLWKFSRHPNYFGEILVWIGIYVSSVRGLRGLQHLAIVSPIFLSWLLLFVSGVPLLEESADRKHGDKEEYVEYKRKTSVVIPCPSRVYRRLPVSVRGTLFLEFGIYDNLRKDKEEEAKRQ